MALDKTKIYSLSRMNEREVKDFLNEHDITGLWLECIFMVNDYADGTDLIKWEKGEWTWAFNYDLKNKEIIKVKQ